MKYTGRITAVLLDLIVIVTLLFFYYRTYGYIQPYEIITDIVSLGICWLCGKQYDKAKYYADKDALTELYNRRFVYKTFPKILAKAKKRNQRIHVFIVNVDDFKKINDSFGHEIGDSVLQSISTALLQNTRKTDIVARWGGDEFLIILSCDDSLPFIERIEENLKKISNEIRRNISISIGNSIYPDNGGSLDDLIKNADKDMYKLKFSNERFAKLVFCR
jgi:diguanylate cyclase (GGDEF)-like protein